MSGEDFLTWRDGWSLDIENFDNDHKVLVVLLNQLALASLAANDTTCPEIKCHIELYDKLLAHIQQHFEREESFMLEVNFPDYAEHKAEHQMQLASFAALRRSLLKRSTGCLSVDELDGVKAWFLDHVAGEDRRYAEYYAELVESNRLSIDR